MTLLNELYQKSNFVSFQMLLIHGHQTGRWSDCHLAERVKMKYQGIEVLVVQNTNLIGGHQRY